MNSLGEFQSEPLILASKSPVRAALLRNAGLKIKTASADIDERSVEEALGNEVEAEDVALVLAEAKALDVATGFQDALVIGADQTLSCEGMLVHKATSEKDLRQKLLWLSGKTHTLNSAVTIVRNNETMWRKSAQAHLTMRSLTPEFIGRYVAETLPETLQSVGGYHLEGIGAQLFEDIKGDYFTVLGLPLLPLLSWLRAEQVLMR